MQKIPATVITGFLGAGKTTMIRNMLMNAEGRKIALIINEFGDLGVDGDVLKGCGAEACTEDDIIELNNGCICCTVADDFIPTMEKLLARNVKPDHIVIETSGLALPQPLVAAFNWPDIRTRVTVEQVAREDLRDLLVWQLQCDRIVRYAFALALIARPVVMPRPVVFATVLVRLGECEPEMDVRALPEPLTLELAFHRLHLRVFEPERLEVGHAPVHFAERRLRRDGRPVGLERTRLVALRLQHVAEAQLHVR